MKFLVNYCPICEKKTAKITESSVNKVNRKPCSDECRKRFYKKLKINS